LSREGVYQKVQESWGTVSSEEDSVKILEMISIILSAIASFTRRQWTWVAGIVGTLFLILSRAYWKDRAKDSEAETGALKGKERILEKHGQIEDKADETKKDIAGIKSTDDVNDAWNRMRDDK
jgi:hypothetical protein